jgi:hypothetical protein
MMVPSLCRDCTTAVNDAIRRTHTVFWQNYLGGAGQDGDEDAPLWFLNLLRDAATRLAGEIRPGVLHELMQVMDRFVADIRDAVKGRPTEAESRGRTVGTGAVPVKSGGERLCVLVEEALPPGHDLATLVGFGTAQGAVESMIDWRRLCESFAEKVPRLTEAAQSLSEVYRQAVPELDRLRRPPPEPTEAGLISFVQEVLARGADSHQPKGQRTQ